MHPKTGDLTAGDPTDRDATGRDAIEPLKTWAPIPACDDPDFPNCTDRDAIITIGDPGLETLVRRQLRLPRGSITCSDMLELREIQEDNPAAGAEVASLEGIEHAIHLRHLRLPNHQVADLRPLACLVRIDSL